MEISTTFDSTPRFVMQSYRACHRSAYVRRRLVAFAMPLVGLVVAPTVALVLLVYAFAFVAYSELSIRRQLRVPLSGPTTVTVTMSDEEYRVDSPRGASARPWSVFASVVPVGDFWVLRLSKKAAMALPKDALDAVQTADFESFLRSKGLRSAAGVGGFSC
jgi:hypothetical protein